jgi:hypothetical protein
MIDLATYVLEPLHHEGACACTAASPRRTPRRISPRCLSWPRSGPTPPRPASSGSRTC